MNLDERAASIDSWRHSVPSRLERKDPFANDGFEARPSTRLVSFSHLPVFLSTFCCVLVVLKITAQFCLAFNSF